jgi:nucleoside-diphosphate-sugar epimerase
MTTTLITGAGGFVGSALVRRLSASVKPGDRIVATDLSLSEQPALPGVEYIVGSIDDAAHIASLAEHPLQRVFHLATIAGVQQSDFQLGKRINLEATIALLDALSKQATPVRFVYSSSVGVFGTPFPAVIDDDTLPVPPWSYGTHKFVCELLIADYARAGLVDGIALRFPGIVARPQGSTTMLSAFVSDVFYAAREGRGFALPMAADDATWLMSLRKVVDNVIYASGIPAEDLPARRAWTLPALAVTMHDLVAALAEAFGPAADRIGYAPNPAAQKLFSMPALRTPGAESLGLTGDETASELVQNVIAENPALR